MKSIPITILISLLALIIASCSAGTLEFTSTPTSILATTTPAPTDTFTALPPTETDTPIPPTATETPIPTDTPEPSLTMTETEQVVVSCAGLENLYDGSKVRLTVINESGYDVFIKLEGCGGGSYMDLMIPAGIEGNPKVKVLTAERDQYLRKILQCNGIESKGTLSLDGNMRLTFIPCEATPTSIP